MANWISVAIAFAVLLLGSLTQFAIFSFFMGKMKGAQEALSSQLTALVAQLAGFQGSMQALQTHRAELDVRMETVERNAAGIATMSERLSRHLGVYDVHHDDLVKRQEKTDRILEGLQRTMANITSRGIGGITPLD